MNGLEDDLQIEIIRILFVEDIFPIPVRWLELKAHAPAQVPVGWDEDDSPVTSGQWNVTLSQEIAAVGQKLCVTRNKAR